MPSSSVEHAYDVLRRMTVGFEFRPGEHLNEVALARMLGMSRAPVREAMNRLTGEGLVLNRPGLGFFCRGLRASEIGDLYTVRADLESGALAALLPRLDEAPVRAVLTALRATWAQLPRADVAGGGSDHVADQDEAFHTALAALAGNGERDRMLAVVNARIRFVRRADLASVARTAETIADHIAILDALLGATPERAPDLLRAHLDAGARTIEAAVRDGLLRPNAG
ncbi:putative transcriptional regulator [Ameyamaea chiangmaiensis NBRC 103196]|uniref:GntR family transcriptional regulator n=1 Tax=Ameyamaea chiangmaiensis TaxID=442969 RepID=A0A850PCS9_9PROT|nr:GntR family transcriptional regulator [Ameyamaea chiangmaiensis]MBS4074722.1 GntR family transcriptional regulator [Ameyamaea chiangmaiensis]NVN41788.1 GntR family transcriptional regulator [Ameyamaea chiangmaiensis]GBQ62494.1 putative transcriptional regulator [Ameyamaea chiangmaiensis NBRC 103196]